jgi:hypothetical protein
MAAMPELTHRPDPDSADCWHIYFGDVHVGTIARAVGNPSAGEQWQWLCGFYPGSHPGEHRGGRTDSFDQTRDAFARAWRIFSANRTEADYQAWRDQRDWAAKKYAAQDRGERLPTAQ